MSNYLYSARFRQRLGDSNDVLCSSRTCMQPGAVLELLGIFGEFTNRKPTLPGVLSENFSNADLSDLAKHRNVLREVERDDFGKKCRLIVWSSRSSGPTRQRYQMNQWSFSRRHLLIDNYSVMLEIVGSVNLLSAMHPRTTVSFKVVKLLGLDIWQRHGRCNAQIDMSCMQRRNSP